MSTVSSRCLCAIAMGLCAATPAHATLFTHITAEQGILSYDLKSNEGNGWYTEPGTDYRFKVGFKQGERQTADPILVATLGTTTSEHFAGASALQLQIDARSELKSKGAAYKVAIASVKPKDPFSPSVTETREWFHGFAMKIDADRFKLPTGAGQCTFFEQFHQGSPFHPPISLAIVNPTDAAEMGWKDPAPNGHFALVLIDDDHGPLTTLPGKPVYHDLGPVVLGQWIRWVVRVKPSPTKPQGAITIYMNGSQKLDLSNIKVGLDPKNPQYTTHKPQKVFDYVDVMIYRPNGDNFQRIFFDEIRFADRLQDASPP